MILLLLGEKAGMREDVTTRFLVKKGSRDSRPTNSCHFQIFLGPFNVRNGAGLEPASVMRQAKQTVFGERLMPENFHGEFVSPME